MKKLKLLTLASCISVALVGCNTDNEVIFSDAGLVSARAIDGYLVNAEVYPLDEEGECLAGIAAAIGTTAEGGLVQGAAEDFVNGFCVVATSATIDEDTNASVGKGFVLTTPPPSVLGVDITAGEEMIASPMTTYLTSTIIELRDENPAASPEELIKLVEDEKAALATELGVDVTVLFGDFIKGKDKKAHGFGRLLTKMIAEQGTFSRKEIKNIAKISKKNLEKLADVNNAKYLVSFTSFMVSNITIIQNVNGLSDAELDTKLVEIETQVSNPEFDTLLAKLSTVDIDVDAVKTAIETKVAEQLTNIDLNVGLDLAEILIEGIEIDKDKDALDEEGQPNPNKTVIEQDSDNARLVLAMANYGSLDSQEVRFVTSENAAFAPTSAQLNICTATYAETEGKGSLTVTAPTCKNDAEGATPVESPLLIKEPGTYTFTLFVEKIIEGVPYTSVAQTFDIEIEEFNTAPEYVGNDAQEVLTLLETTLPDAATFTVDATGVKADTFTISASAIDFTTLFTDVDVDAGQTLEISLTPTKGFDVTTDKLSCAQAEAGTDSEAGTAKTLLPVEGITEACDFELTTTLPAFVDPNAETQVEDAVESKEYRFSVTAKDALGKEAAQSLNVSILIELNPEAAAEDGSDKYLATLAIAKADGIADIDLSQVTTFAIPVSKLNEKIVEKIVEELLDAKLAGADAKSLLTVNSLLPVRAFTCKDETESTFVSDEDINEIQGPCSITEGFENLALAVNYKITDEDEADVTELTIEEDEATGIAEFALGEALSGDKKRKWFVEIEPVTVLVDGEEKEIQVKFIDHHDLEKNGDIKDKNAKLEQFLRLDVHLKEAKGKDEDAASVKVNAKVKDKR